VPITVATESVLDEIAGELLVVSKRLEHMMNCGCEDPRIRRAQIMIEELGETIEGLANRDEVATLDGLSDLIFVAVGTAVAFDLPVKAGIREVCFSNLTKAVRRPGDVRLRDKGTSYVPPNLELRLIEHREARKVV
jgi:hypothetical protein